MITELLNSYYELMLQQREDEVNSLKTEAQRLNKTRETIQRKLRQVEDLKSDTERERETLRGQITGLERGPFEIFLFFS